MQRLFSLAAIAASIVAGSSVDSESNVVPLEKKLTQKSFDLGKLILKKGANPTIVKRVVNPSLYKRIPKKRIFRWKWSQPYLKRNSRRYKRVFPSRSPLLKKRPAPLVVSKSVRSYSAKPHVSVGHAYDRFRPMKKP